MSEESSGAPYQGSVTLTCAPCGEHFGASHTCRCGDDVAESCPLCGEDVAPGAVRADSGVPWGPHHAHARCAPRNLAARVAERERIVVAIHGPRALP